MTQCDICVSTYNKLIKKKVECPKCNFCACRNCIETYTTSKNDDFHCMSCKQAWDYEFFLNSMTQACVKRIMLHRQHVLLERERAKMPDTQVYVCYHKEIEKDKTLLLKLCNTVALLDKSIIINVDLIETKLNEMRDNPKFRDGVIKVIDELNEKIEEVRKQKKALYVQIGTIRRKIYRWETNLNMKDEEDKSTFVNRVIMKCTCNDCKGFVMSDWKCGICETEYCEKCLSVKKAEEEETTSTAVTHVCKKENVKTAELIKTSTRACPNCAVLIHRINGCSQMWCPSCQTTFNYNTGEIDRGIIHNPHYYEWYRKNKQVVDNKANDDQNNCNRNINQNQMMRHISVAFGYNSPESNRLYYYNRLYGHLGYMIRDIPENDVKDVKYNMKHRIQWMLNELSDEDFKKILLKEEKQHKYNLNRRHIYTMCQTLFNDVSHKVLRCNYKEDVLPLINEYKEMLDYSNQSLKEVAKLYGIRAKDIK